MRQFEEGVAEVGIGALASGELPPSEGPPFGEERVAHDLGVDERERKAKRTVGRKSLGVNPFTAADHDFAGKGVRDGECGVERSGHADTGLGEGVVARDYNGLAAIGPRVRPSFVADPPEDDDLPGGGAMEVGGVLGDSPRKLAGTADDAVLGAGNDEVERLGHGHALMKGRRTEVTRQRSGRCVDSGRVFRAFFRSLTL